MTDTELRLSIGQAVAGAVFVAGTAASALIPGSGGQILSAVLAISGLIVALGLEFFKSNHRRDHLDKQLLSQEARLVKALDVTKEELNSTLDRYCANVRDLSLDGLRARPDAAPIFEAWRSFFVEWATAHLEGNRIKLAEESRRMSLLEEAYLKSTKYVYAFTYGTPAYIMSFWGDEAINGYLAAQVAAIHVNPRLDLRRVIVVTDDLIQHEAAWDVFAKTSDNLYKSSLTNLFLTTEAEAKRVCAQIPKSFLIADDGLFSEASEEGFGYAGDVGYDELYVAKLKKIFFTLQTIAGEKLSQEEAKDPLRKIRNLRKGRGGIVSGEPQT